MEVVDSFERTVGYPPCGVVRQDLFSPYDDRVHNVAVFGCLTGGVEISEPSERLRWPGPGCRLRKVGRAFSRGSETGMSVEQPIEMCLVGFG